jgi:hypothetical protein
MVRYNLLCNSTLDWIKYALIIEQSCCQIFVRAIRGNTLGFRFRINHILHLLDSYCGLAPQMAQWSGSCQGLLLTLTLYSLSPAEL